MLKEIVEENVQEALSPGLSDKGRSRKEVSCSQSLIDVKILKCFISSDLSWLTFLPSVGMGFIQRSAHPSKRIFTGKSAYVHMKLLFLQIIECFKKYDIKK